mmetsp:Transcript_70287/g.150513  ORF Transcript_70287/g.150513 Transcript_70287/m.150513 type:complete len:402 (+) Transcript_70287:1339-2544(+)
MVARESHHVLRKLDLAKTRAACDDHRAALAEGAPGWRPQLGTCPSGPGLGPLLVQVLIELAPQELVRLVSACPVGEGAKQVDVASELLRQLLPVHALLRHAHGPLVPGEVDSSVYYANLLRRLRQIGREDGNGIRLALHLDGVQGSVFDLPRREACCRLVDQDAVLWRIGHEPRREVDHIAQHSILHARGAAADAAIGPARGDAEAALQTQPLEDLDHVKASENGARRVVGVHQRRQAVDKEEEHALVVDDELVERAFVGIADPLDGGHQVLCGISALIRARVHTRARDEDRGDVPHLIYIGEGAPLDLFEDRRGDVAAENAQLRELELLLVALVRLHSRILHRRKSILRLLHLQEQVEIGPVIQRPTRVLDYATIHVVPGLWADTGFPILGQRLRDGDLL